MISIPTNLFRAALAAPFLLASITAGMAQSSSTPSLSSIYTTRAYFNAAIASGSSEAVVTLEYGLTTSYDSTLAGGNSPIAANQTNATCFFDLSGLQAATTYHCRVKVVNGEGTGYSADTTFTTLEEPVITTGLVDSITDLSAVISGTLDRKGGQYTIYAQLGTTTAYGQTAGLGNTTLLTGPQPFSNAVSTLLPSTTYHYRIAVSDIFNNTYYGSDQTFTTAAANTAPELQPNSLAVNVQTPTRTELYLTWLKTGSSATTVSYEYGPTTAYGSVAVHPTPRPVNRFEELYVAPVQLTDLTPGTTYHVRAKAVNAQGTVYTDDRTFTTPVGPVLTTGTASSITDLAATVGGTVNTNSLLLEVSFEYGTSTSYGSSEWVSPFQQNTSPAPVSVSLLYLLPGTTYHYRIKAVNHWQPAEVFYGPDATFTTAAAATPPTVSALTVSNVLPRSAQLHCAAVYAGSSSTSIDFLYGTTTSYGHAVDYDVLFSPSTIQSATVTLSGLQPGTTYHAIVVAGNAEGTAQSSDITFTTAAATPPSVGAVSATQVRTVAAQVQAVNVSAGSSIATVEWQYGLTTAYGFTVIANPNTITADTTETITGQFNFLLPASTYHYRCRVTSMDGTATSADGTFTTNAGTPTPVTSAATNVIDLSAVLNGSALTISGDLNAFFELGTNSLYGTIITSSPSIISSTNSTPVSAIATGLLPGTTYHYRLCVRDQDNVVYNGPDMSFTTSAPATPPTGATMVPSSVSAQGATLKANVTSGSSPATIVFQYGPTTAYGAQITHAPPLATSQNDVISEPITGLTPSTTYHYRVVVTNNEGTSTGNDVSFTTTAFPTVTTDSASNIHPGSASLNGTHSMNGGIYTAVFDYGETTAYGLTASPNSGGLIIGGGLGGGILIGGGSASVTASVSLRPQKTYHFRLRLTDSYGNRFNGNDATFTTPSAVEVWRQQHFGSTANSGDAADDACPAGDGISNLMKYATWMDPTHSGSQPPPTTVSHNGSTYLSMEFTRNPNALDVSYEVQAADSPTGPWTAVTTIPPGGTPGGTGYLSEFIVFNSVGFGAAAIPVIDIVYVRDTVPLGATPHRFMRLQVQRQP